MSVGWDSVRGRYYNFTTLNINETYLAFASSENGSEYFDAPLHLTLTLLDGSQNESTLQKAFSYGPDPEVKSVDPRRSIIE